MHAARHRLVLVRRTVFGGTLPGWQAPFYSRISWGSWPGPVRSGADSVRPLIWDGRPHATWSTTTLDTTSPALTRRSSGRGPPWSI